jgi:cytochrome c-type biogenesis protein CcmH
MRKLAWYLTLWLGIVSCLFGASGQEAFDDPELNTRYRALISEIRCPKCLNESIAESNAPLAADMRRQVQRLIGEGASDDDVKEFMASRYGEAVLYNPRLSPSTVALWAAPFAFLGLGAFVFWRILAARSTQPLDEELPP